MAGNSKGGIPPALIAVAAVLLIIIAGYIGYATLLKPAAAAPMDKAAEQRSDWIKTLAKQSGGDMSKLSKEDAEKLNTMTNGHAAAALKDKLAEN